MPIELTSLDEERKIGQFFNKLDDLITLHTKRLELLKKKREAYLQKLFPENGKVIPRMRFNGFNDVWQSNLLKNMIVNHSMKSFITVDCDINGKYPVIQQRNKPIWGFSNKSPFKNYDDVVLFGDHTLSLYKPQTPFLIATDGVKAISINDFNPYFTYVVINKYMPHSQGYKRHFSILKMQKIKYPSISEQRKIGKIFEKIDNLINLENKKITLLKQKKQGYLQKMFI